MDIRLQHADTIIFFNLSRTICVYRVIKRWFQYRNQSRPDMGAGCQERVTFEFLKWVWLFPKKQTPAILKNLNPFLMRNKLLF